MLAILNSLNAHNLPIFEPILMILVSKFIVHRDLSDKTNSSLYISMKVLDFHGIQTSKVNAHRRGCFIARGMPTHARDMPTRQDEHT